MSNIPLLTEEERKTRKLWLFSFLSISLYNALYQLYAFKIMPPLIKQASLLYTVSFTAISILLLATQYHCIYRKYGTRWLTFFLYSIPIGSLLGIASLFYAPSSLLKGLPFFTQLFSMVLGLFFWLPCYKMRKVHKKIRKEGRMGASL